MPEDFADDLSKAGQLARSPGKENRCRVVDCGRLLDRHTARGLCNKHYLRWRNYGTTDLPPKPTRADRFWRRVDASGDCWEWVGFKRPNGYGQFGRNVAAHREAWEQLVGTIPDGLELDHLCRNRGCVNPDHLEPVTREENLARGSKPGRKFVSHCPHGHPMEGANVYWLPDGSKRSCRACIRDWKRRKREADRAG